MSYNKPPLTIHHSPIENLFFRILSLLYLVYLYFGIAFIISLVKGIPEGRDVDQALFWVWWDVFKQSLTWLPDTLKWLWDILF